MEETISHGADVSTFLWIAVILLAAKLASLVEKFGQPSVLGELVMGVILGNLALVGITVLEPIQHDSIITFLAELGVVILLFQIGLESNISKMKKVGARAFLVATIGVVAPFTLGTYVVGPWLLPGLSQNAYLFLGAALTATSVGITAAAFLGKIVAGLAAVKGDRLLVGFGMIPRGEVGLIFATIGASLGVISPNVFSVIVIMVILTTLLTPPVLTFLLKRQPVAAAV
ncbi:MAG TPA: cation:proton antiporter [Candidatus Paceibacterota bacterium]